MTDRAAETAARAATEMVLAVPAPDRAGIVVRGGDRLKWLNGLVTCELMKLDADGAAYGLLVEKKGRIQTDLFIVQGVSGGEPELALAVPKELRDDLFATLDHYLIMEDAELEAVDLAFIVAHGPKAGHLLGRGLAPFAGRLDLLGQGGVVLAAPAAEREAFEARVAEAVAALGGVVATNAEWEDVRIEHGLPRFGVEVDATLYPQEAALEKLAVSFSKGCYLGQEVVYMLQERGHVKRKLVSLDLEGLLPPLAGAAVTTPQGEAVGDVKSAVMGPASGKGAAIAMVKWAFAKPGTELRVSDQTARVR